MDKLQPLIKHRFWIIFSLALIFVIVGWWMASSAIASATDARKKSVEESFQKADKNKTEPNAVWVKFAQDKNAIDEKSKANAAKMLWERQQAARTWPASLAADFQKVPFQGEVKQYQTRRKWRRLYKEQIEDLLEIVQPYDPKTKEGLVSVNINSIDHQPFTKWRTQDPVSAEIWTCQEDIWLLKSLLSSIARVNGEATRITEAHVRKINRLSLRGGDPEAKPVAAGGGGMGSMGSMGGMGETSMGGLMGSYDSGSAPGGMGGMGGGGGASAAYPGKEFEGNSGNDILAEEFGAVAGSGGGMGGMGGMGGKGMGSMMMEGGAAPGATGTDSAAAEEDRYVDDKEGQYKTRAFLLDVIVRDDQLPNLLASLTNSDFPVEIRRVEVHAGVISSGGAMGGAGADGSGMTMGGEGEGMGLGSGMGMGMGGGKGMMGSGMGMGGSDMLGAGMVGGSGMGLSAGEMTSPGAGSSGMQGYGPGSSGMGGLGATSAASDPLAVAMADQLLLTVKIGGLMTLYQSKDESTAQSETEKAAATEQTNAAPPDPAEMAAEEPTETTNGDAPADANATSEGAVPAGDVPAGDAPAGEVPAATDTETNPDGTSTDAASEGSAPSASDAKGSEAPKDGSAENEMPSDSATSGEATTPTGDGATSDSGEPGAPEENPK